MLRQVLNRGFDFVGCAAGVFDFRIAGDRGEQGRFVQGLALHDGRVLQTGQPTQASFATVLIAEEFVLGPAGVFETSSAVAP